MPRKNTLKNLTDEEKKMRRREQKKLSMRRARAKLTEAAVEEIRKQDRERYHKKKDRGDIKTIDQFTPRQQRQIRKMWREKSKKRRQLLKMRKATESLIQENTPPASPSSSLSRVESGRAVAARNKRARKAENEALKKKVFQMGKVIKKYRMRIRRLEERKQKASKSSSRNKVLKTDIRKAVHDFLINDEYSRLTAGKNETITRKKSKRQIRLLNDTLLNLHIIFKLKTGFNISYQTFRRYRPFWVLFPKAASRNTCLCTLHENNDHIIRSLQKSKVVSYGSASDAAKALCCNNTLTPKCLERECQSCLYKKIDFNNFAENDYITYDRWVTKDVDVVIKGVQKKCKKCVKETVKTTIGALVKLLHLNLPVFMQHVANMIHQMRSIQTFKQQLTSTKGLLHVDFSENYNCKYSAEVQSAHFGGSKPQLSLHTCVYYSAAEFPNNGFQTTSMCSISKNLRHDPVMICAHLKPILQRIKELSPNLTELHILSDGPTTQYRNKTMFLLIVKFISRELNDVTDIVWHYSEKGHGKGAPDGVGGCIKRLCDSSVAMGKDVSDYDSLMLCLKENCKGIEIYGIGDPNIEDIQEIVDKNAMKAYKGTFKIHQLSWNQNDPNILHARRLSCLSCASNAVCPHFEIGQIKVPSNNTQTHSPLSMADARNVSPRSEDTANASTITYRSDQITPDGGTSHNVPSRPCKRFGFLPDSDDSDVSLPLQDERSKFLSDSDDSDVIFTPRYRHPLPTDSSSEGDFIVRPQQSQKPFVDPYTDSGDDE
ncbi:uncharacterized protein LOC124634596 [Helicoverpa zea]|uniref:uncharacterized protein LOC124634596 n=1 Tax=Helicoverpa zea TaxID=7113 RepID=UPI001F5A032E|nr:uncharacterized protein LOC124634596 [Helicoverpa zea]